MTVHREPKFANKDIYLVACEDASSVKERKTIIYSVNISIFKNNTLPLSILCDSYELV